MSQAPDGTPMEVRRNFGKPNSAAQILEKLRSQKTKGKKSAAAAPQVEVKAAPVAHADDLHALAETIRSENATSSPPSPQATEHTEPTEHAVSTEPKASVKSVKSVVPSVAGKAKARKANASSASDAAPPAPAPAAPTVEPPAVEATSASESTQAAVAKPKQAPPRPPLNTKGMQPKHVVEAALFSAGKPISVEEISQETKLHVETIKKAIKELAADYDARDTVLEVGKAGTKWAMQVRSRAAEPAARFAPMEIAPKLLKTLALIAYHQPMKQSELVNMIGTKVYEHIPELIERGLVRAREDGPTKILATTPAFPEYFGLDAEDPEQVRAVMGKLVGIEAPPKPKAETVTYEDEQVAPGPAPQTSDVTSPPASESTDP